MVLWLCNIGVIAQDRLNIEVKLLLSAREVIYAASSGTTTDDLG